MSCTSWPLLLYLSSQPSVLPMMWHFVTFNPNVIGDAVLPATAGISNRLQSITNRLQSITNRLQSITNRLQSITWDRCCSPSLILVLAQLQLPISDWCISSCPACQSMCDVMTKCFVASTSWLVIGHRRLSSLAHNTILTTNEVTCVRWSFRLTAVVCIQDDFWY
jgi:hypothetical protein